MHALLTERRRSSPDGNRSLPSPSSSLMVTACCSYPMVTSGILWVLIEGAIRSPSTSLRCGAPARSSFGKTAFFQKAPRSSLDEGKPILPSRASFRRKPPEVKLSEGSRQRLSFPKDVQKKVASFGNLWRFPKEANFFRFLREASPLAEKECVLWSQCVLSSRRNCSVHILRMQIRCIIPPFFEGSASKITIQEISRGRGLANPIPTTS